MNKALVCILLLLASVRCGAQNYSGYASSFYDNTSEEFTITSSVEDAFRIYHIKNISEERYTFSLFTKTKSGKWVLVGGATLDPGRKTSRLAQKGGTSRTLIFYCLSTRREKLPTAEEVNRVESSY